VRSPSRPARGCQRNVGVFFVEVRRSAITITITSPSASLESLMSTLCKEKTDTADHTSSTMRIYLFLLSTIALYLSQHHVAGFVLNAGRSSGIISCWDGHQSPTHSIASALFMVVENEANEASNALPVLSDKEELVYDLLKDLSNAKFPFRVVVVGNGAILESTNLLGPTFKVSQSPATGANLVTFASEDQSFEFHLMIAQVSKVAMIEKPSPVKEGKTMRIMRFLNAEEKSICSLILADESADATGWFQRTVSKYGPEMIIH
jgi:hypothetical protein